MHKHTIIATGIPISPNSLKKSDMSRMGVLYHLSYTCVCECIVRDI
jgi:hypothetical protein